jgi:3-methyladenine DNA glycosylase/8-oxoguanine DNA glycosylase
MEALAEPWRPWRSVAARLFWHNYLCRRGKNLPGQLADAAGPEVAAG